MTRAEAEAIVKRDLPTCIEAVLALAPFDPGAQLRQLMYDQMYETAISGILDGTIRLVVGRLVFTQIGSARVGPNPKAN